MMPISQNTDQNSVGRIPDKHMINISGTVSTIKPMVSDVPVTYITAGKFFFKMIVPMYSSWVQIRLQSGVLSEVVVVVVILFPEEYNITHSIGTTCIKSFHKSIPVAVAREADAHRADNRYFHNDTAGGEAGC